MLDSTPPGNPSPHSSFSPKALIVDDHPLVRDGLRIVLENFGNINVDCEAADGETALQLARTHLPDLILLDVNLNGMDGFETASRLKQICPAARIVLISGSCEQEILSRALNEDIDGYIIKSQRPEKLVQLIDTAMAGEFCWTSCLENLNRIWDEDNKGTPPISQPQR